MGGRRDLNDERRAAKAEGREPVKRFVPVPGPDGAAADDDCRPIVMLPRGDVENDARVILARLAADNDPRELFVFNGRLAHVVVTDGRADVRMLATWEALASELGREYRFARPADDGSPPKRLPEPPRPACRTIVQRRPDALPFPLLRTIIRAPGVAPDGRLLVSDGYYEAVQSWVALAGLDIPPVPERPAPDDVRAAVALLRETFVDFPFDNETSRVNALAFLLTPFVRPLLPEAGGCAPLFLVSAAAPGTGKTLLTDVVAMVAAGGGAAVADVALDLRSEAETGKRLLAALRASPAFVRLDNLPQQRRVESAELARALTSDVYGGRILGLSEVAAVPNRATWCATANNPSLSAELADRCVHVRLVAPCERPRDRDAAAFRHPLPAWAVANRGRLVAACLTLIRHWLAVGCPRGSVGFGSFEEWARTLSGVLEAADVRGALANRREWLETADDDSDLWRAIVAAWWECYADRPIRAGELLSIAQGVEGGDAVGGAPDASQPSRTKRAGDALRQRVGRVYGDFRIVEGPRDGKRNARTYQLTRAGAGAGERGEPRE